MYAVVFWNANKKFVDVKIWEYNIIKLYKLYMNPHLVLVIPEQADNLQKPAQGWKGSTK
jgi:hypothetical protein